MKTLTKSISATYIQLSKLAILLSLSLAAPFLQHQLITGSIVNALLFSAVLLVGFRYALLVTFLPSIISLAVGLLPFVLAPMIPFIIISNCLLILTFALLKNKNFWLAVLCSSYLKFLFLLSTSSLLINFVFKGPITKKVSIMFSWPQLITALLGGIIAYLVLKVIKKTT